MRKSRQNLRESRMVVARDWKKRVYRAAFNGYRISVLSTQGEKCCGNEWL